MPWYTNDETGDQYWLEDESSSGSFKDPFAGISGYNQDAFGSTPKPTILTETPGSDAYISGINTGAFAPQYGTSQGAPYVYDNTGVVAGVGKTSGMPKIGGSLASAKKLVSGFMDKDGNIDFMKALLGLAAIKSMSDERGRQQQARGYKGGIPKYAATRTQIAQPAYVPYSGQAVMGGKQLSDVQYAAKGGIMGLRDGAFVIPADVVSHFGNGSSEAGLKFLAEKLGATPIKGDGDGMSDSIDTTIDGKQPAKVAHEEAIVSPEKVKALGGGDPKKGAKKLYAMMDRVRKARTGTKKQGKQINPEKFTPGGIAGYAGGGAVAFAEGDLVKSTSPGTSTTSNLSEWAGPYVTDMLGKAQALAGQGYQAYTGPLTAGYSPLQQQAFTGYGTMQVPSSIGQAAQTAGDVASKAGGMGYAPSQFTNQYTATGAYTPTTATSGFNAPGQYQGVDFTGGMMPQQYQAGQFGNQFQGPGAYQAGQFNTGLGPVGSVQSYMSPYLQGVTDIEAREARRQADIDRTAAASRLAQAGAYGGSRQAIMEAEGLRNLQTRIGDITSKGLQSAYDRALQQRLAESQASMEAQKAGEASRQFGAQQGMTGAQLAAQYGLAGQELGERSRQFGATQGLQGLQMMLDARKAQEASRQFGAQQAMTGAQSAAQYGLQAQQQTAQERQFAAQQKAQADQLRAQYGLSAQQAAEASRQFGAGYGLDALRQQLAAAQLQGTMGTQQGQLGLQNLAAQLAAGEQQRAIEQQGIAAKQAEFEKQRLYPYQQLQFQQSMLQGLPISTYSNVPQTTGMQDLSTLLRQIYGIGQSETGTTTP